MATSREFTKSPDSFWVKVEKTDGCWYWTGTRYPKGYGKVALTNMTSMSAHRAAYELVIGPIPAGLTLDHLCRVRHCVNPAHLEPCTNRENVLRGEGHTAVNARKTHCPQGHEYAGANVVVSPEGWRRCRACKNAKDRARRARA